MSVLQYATMKMLKSGVKISKIPRSVSLFKSNVNDIYKITAFKMISSKNSGIPARKRRNGDIKIIKMISKK